MMKNGRFCVSKYILDIYKPIIPKATNKIDVTKKITLINNHNENPSGLINDNVLVLCNFIVAKEYEQNMNMI